MAVDALARRYGVCTSQGESCSAVVEAGVGPARRVVALRALSVRELLFRVLRVRRTSVVGLMARKASGAAQGVIVVNVTIDALARRDRVHAGQWKPSRAVVKLRVQPVVRAVTPLAVLDGERLRTMLRIRSAKVIGLMARITIRRHRLELAVGRILVTRIAIDRSVRSGQRESIVVILDLLYCHLPTAHGMALLAVRA